MVFNIDCMQYMKECKKNSMHTTLTDIPYGEVSRTNNGLSQMKNSDKGFADKTTFDLIEFLDEIYRITSDNIIIFCGKGQFSTIYNYFAAKSQGTVRQIIWRKTNPVPSNGRYVYLSGIENAVWFRKPKGTFNAHCKNTVFEYPEDDAELEALIGDKILSYPIQSKQIHPTEKSHRLIEELILDNTNEGDIIFDPCMGSGSTGLMAYKNNRKFIGCELNTEAFEKAKARLQANGWEKD